MRALVVCLCALVLLGSTVWAQEKTDVIYLKNGDVRKGTIIENVPNDYVKIETSDGSIFTVKYADIQKMTKEAKPVQQSQQRSGSEVSGQGLMARGGDFGIMAGVWLNGKIHFEDFDLQEEKNTGFLARAFYDAYVAEKFSVGVYAQISPMSWEDSDEGSFMYEFGFTLKPRFPLAGGAAAFKPGLSIGYRGISSDIPESDKINALAMNVSLEVQFQTSGAIVPFIELGFLAQPAGGNDPTKVTFPPIVYFGAGIEL